MKALLPLALIVSMSSIALAKNAKVEKIAAKLKANDVRTVVTEVENTDHNPCMPEGKSFLIKIQVKQAGYDRENNKIVYKWETAKTVGVDKDGGVMEVCAE